MKNQVMLHAQDKNNYLCILYPSNQRGFATANDSFSKDKNNSYITYQKCQSAQHLYQLLSATNIHMFKTRQTYFNHLPTRPPYYNILAIGTQH